MTFVCGRENAPPVNGWRRRVGGFILHMARRRRKARESDTMKKPGKTLISEEDWNRYVKVVRRRAARSKDEKNPKG